MNKLIEKIRSNKKIAICIASAILIIVGVILFFVITSNGSKSKSASKAHSSGEIITTKNEDKTKENKTESNTTTKESESSTTEIESDKDSEKSTDNEQQTTEKMTDSEQNTIKYPIQTENETTTSTPISETPKATENEGSKVEYQYGIPIVRINTVNKTPVTSNIETIMATFSLEGRNTGYADIKSAGIKIRGRGHSTWKLDKKPFQIKFDEKTSVMGMTEAKRYILLANYLDKSLMRNHIAFKMGETLDNLVFVPHSFPVDVYLNGEYIGVYSMGEKIEVKKGRVEIDKANQNNSNTGYMLEVGGFDDEDDGYVFDTEFLKEVVVKTPEYELINSNQTKYIEDYVKSAEKAIKNLSNYEEYIDVPSFVDWFILHELTYNLDSCFNRSCYMVKAANGKLQMGPPWDFDVAFGNYQYDNKNYDGWASVGANNSSSYIKVTWMNYLLSDSKFNAQVKKRWAEKKDELVNTALSQINLTKNKIYKSQIDNFNAWDIWNIKVGEASDATTALRTYDEQVEYLKNFIRKRKQWMDSAINSLP